MLGLAIALAGCGGGGGTATAGSATTSGSSSASTRDTSGSSTASSGGGACSSRFLDHASVMVGAMMADATANAAPFDARYLYLAGGVRAAGTCASACSTSCSQWWGCWQDMTKAPGQYVTALLDKTAAATWQGAAHAQMPMFTYYELLQSAGSAEGAAEVAAAQDGGLMGRYFADWRFLLQTLGPAKAMLHIEPDFWGYVRQVNADPTRVPVAVASANPTDCAAQPDTAAGMARCMIAMVRKYAPNARVGLHASPWMRSVAGDGAATGKFMLALGAAAGDFMVIDLADRDAGYNQSIGRDTWWTDADETAFLSWSKALADTTGLSNVLWQIPLGNMAQDDTALHWKDNRVDWLFSHLDSVAQAGTAALMFGAGESQQTTPETDGGNLVAKTLANWQAGGTPLCQ